MRPEWLEPLIALVAPALCVACGAHAGRAEPLCLRCRAGLVWLGEEQAPAAGVPAWAAVSYAAAARDLVAALKFRGARPVARAMAGQIAVAAPPGLLQGSVLVPVPLHPSRLRSRGFNQARLIAVDLAARTGIPLSDCLERGGPATTQVGRDRRQRAAGISGRVGTREGVPVPPAVLVVDDVITTGATLGACERALRGAGAVHVRALAYARTPGR